MVGRYEKYDEVDGMMEGQIFIAEDAEVGQAILENDVRAERLYEREFEIINELEHELIEAGVSTECIDRWRRIHQKAMELDKADNRLQVELHERELDQVNYLRTKCARLEHLSLQEVI